MEHKDIFAAVRSNDLKAVKQFVERERVPLNRTSTDDEEGRTVAHIAAKNGNLNILEYVLKKDANLLRSRDSTGATVLTIAVERNSLKMVKYLVDDCKTDIFQPYCLLSADNYIHYAALLGRVKIFKYFIEEKKVDPNLKDSNGQPLAFSAARADSLKIIKYLVEECKANVRVRDSAGRNILVICAAGGAVNVPKYLLDKQKFKLDINNTPILHEAIKYTVIDPDRFFNFIEYFVEKKHIDVNGRDEYGKSALHWAAIGGHMHIVKYLLQHGADLNLPDNMNITPLQELAIYDEEAAEYAKEEAKKRTRTRRSLPELINPIISQLNAEYWIQKKIIEEWFSLEDYRNDVRELVDDVNSLQIFANCRYYRPEHVKHQVLPSSPSSNISGEWNELGCY